jgi:hypothetical protein
LYLGVAFGGGGGEAGGVIDVLNVEKVGNVGVGDGVLQAEEVDQGRLLAGPRDYAIDVPKKVIYVPL